MIHLRIDWTPEEAEALKQCQTTETLQYFVADLVDGKYRFVGHRDTYEDARRFSKRRDRLARSRVLMGWMKDGGIVTL